MSRPVLLVENFYERVRAGEVPIAVVRSDGLVDIGTWDPGDLENDPLYTDEAAVVHDVNEHVVDVARTMRGISERTLLERRARGIRPAEPVPITRSFAPFHDPEYEGGELDDGMNIWQRAQDRLADGRQPFFGVGEDGMCRYLSTNPLGSTGAFHADPGERIHRMVAYLAELNGGRWDNDPTIHDVRADDEEE